MKPIVAMNSSTGMPLSTWTFLKTSSAMRGLALGACAVAVFWPQAADTLSIQTASVRNPPLHCFNESFIACVLKVLVPFPVAGIYTRMSALGKRPGCGFAAVAGKEKERRNWAPNEEQGSVLSNYCVVAAEIRVHAPI